MDNKKSRLSSAYSIVNSSPFIIRPLPATIEDWNDHEALVFNFGPPFTVYGTIISYLSVTAPLVNTMNF